MDNFIVIGILVIIIGLAIFYVFKAKKNGKKCIGCPDCSACSSKNQKGGCCSCDFKK